MNAKASLLALAVVFAGTLANAQIQELHALRDAVNAQDNVQTERTFDRADMGRGNSAFNNGGQQDDGTPVVRLTSNVRYYAQATVLVRGNAFQPGTQMIIDALGRTKKDAMTQIRNQVSQIAGARILQVTFRN